MFLTTSTESVLQQHLCEFAQWGRMMRLRGRSLYALQAQEPPQKKARTRGSRVSSEVDPESIMEGRRRSTRK